MIHLELFEVILSENVSTLPLSFTILVPGMTISPSLINVPHIY